MPKKTLPAAAVPTLVQERLHVWGQCIKRQRVSQNIAAADLCARLTISDSTLRRLERGDAGAGAALYLAALMVLGVLDQAAPMLPTPLWAAHARQRVRRPAGDTDADF
jgi:transcriptional regulator with XRE-family HTH domain